VNGSLDHRHSAATWKWSICGLLLLASAINYMDRQTLANAATRIRGEFKLDRQQYGTVEARFGVAFAAGSLLFGWLADRMAIRGLYAMVLLMWSLAGFATGFARDYHDLLWCRTLLGFFEAGHWPCAVRTTRMLLDERERSMGNGLLQGGASIGAIITPLIMTSLMTSDPRTWRTPFLVVGGIGLLWLIPWYALLRKQPLRPASDKASKSQPASLKEFGRLLVSSRMLIVFLVVTCINLTWQILRAWLPQILQEEHGYTEDQSLYFNSVYFMATEVGCIVSGALAAWLGKRYLSVHGARLAVFGVCAAACGGACALVPWLDQGWLLLTAFAVAGAGSLGVFPLYHAFTQDISGEHQGKITGAAGVVAWLASAPIQQLFGRRADVTGSFDEGILLAGILPAVAFFVIWLFWKPGLSTYEDHP
jgi:ACS family hexuronate transporter-like MFS transporter